MQPDVRISRYPVLLFAADPPLLADADAVAEAKAVAVAEAFAEEHGCTFAGVLEVPQRRDRKRRAS